MKQVAKCKSLESIEKIRLQGTSDNINEFIKKLEHEQNQSIFKITLDFGSEEELKQKSVKRLLSSKNLKELYSNLNNLANEYSYSYLNKQFELFFGFEIDKNAFRVIKVNENYLKSWLVNGFTYNLRSYFNKIKNQYKKEKELSFDSRFKKISNEVLSKFPILEENKEDAGYNLFQTLLKIIKDDDCEAFEKLVDDLSILLIKVSANSIMDSVVVNVFYSRENFDLTVLPRNNNLLNHKASSIKFYIAKEDQKITESYEFFRFVFTELLKRELLNSYKTYLEYCIDDSKEFKLDGTNNLFLSSNNSVRHTLEHVLKSCGIISNFSKNEKHEMANIISEILNE